MHVLGVAEMKIGLVSFHFDKHGAYLLFAIGIYQVWWPRAKWQGNICSVVNSSGKHIRGGCTPLCSLQCAEKIKALQASVRECALELSWFNPDFSSPQPLLGATPGHNRNAGRAFPLLLLPAPSHLCDMLHLPLPIPANAGSDIASADQLSLSGLKMWIGLE